jgi:hypothetical protein
VPGSRRETAVLIFRRLVLHCAKGDTAPSARA